MSNNISHIRYIRGQLYIDAEKAKAFDEAENENLPEQHFCESRNFRGKEGLVPLKNVFWCGEFSGHSNRDGLFAKALTLTIGEADLLLVFEGGDSFAGLRVIDGKVEKYGVKFSLDEDGKKADKQLGIIREAVLEVCEKEKYDSRLE